MRVIKVQEIQNRVFATDENGFVWVKHPEEEFKLFEISAKSDLMDQLRGMQEMPSPSEENS